MTNTRGMMLIGVLCGGLLLGTGGAQADAGSARVDDVTWQYGDGWDRGDRYRPRDRWSRRHAPAWRWKGARRYGPGLRRGPGTLIWAVPPRHFWPTQRWRRGQCYRVEHLPFGRVRHVPLPKAACF